MTESSPANIEDYKELLGGCKKNYLSKALLYMQKSLLLSTPGITTTEQKGLLQVYVGLPTLINITQKEYPSSNSTKSVTSDVFRSPKDSFTMTYLNVLW